MGEEAEGKRRIVRVRPWLALGAWAVVAALVLLWWAANYTSYIAMLAEWQFSRFGRYYPTLTFAAFIVLVTVPIAFGIRLWHDRRRVRDRNAMPKAHYESQVVERTLIAARRGVQFFAWLAILGVVVALGIAVTIPGLPTGVGGIRAIDAGSRFAPEGHARLVGQVDLGRVGRFDEDLLIARRLIFVAPVMPRGPVTARPLRFFTVVVPIGGDRSFIPIPSGVLVRQGLPREVIHMYREAGHAVDDDAYLLMEDDAQVRWRPLVLAAEAAGLALFALLFWALFRRHARRLADQIEKSGLTRR